MGFNIQDLHILSIDCLCFFHPISEKMKSTNFLFEMSSFLFCKSNIHPIADHEVQEVE